MECLTVSKRLSGYLDGNLPGEHRREINAHLQHCSACARLHMQYENLRKSLRQLPVRAPSPHLTTSLRVLASRERIRHSTHVTFGRMFSAWKDRMAISLGNLMRPIAVPLVGGVTSAVLLFTMLVPDLAVVRANSPDDTPTALVTEASVKGSTPLGFNDSAVVVEVLVDGQGRMIDYKIVSPKHLHSAEVRRSIENNLLFTVFTPATTFGQATCGKVRITFVTSHTDVRG